MFLRGKDLFRLRCFKGKVLRQHKRSWLVFVDDCGLGARLAKVWKHPDRMSSASNPEQTLAGSINTIMQSVRAVGATTSICLNRWIKKEKFQTESFIYGVLRANDTPITIEAFDAAQPLGFYSLLYLAQALEKHGVVAPLRIEFISNHLQEIGEGDRLRPEKATALGPCKVIPQEYTQY